MRCLVSGELVEPVATHSKIRGLADVGGLSMGDVLPAFKQESFRSYGLAQAANAAMSEEVMAGYTAALNRLIREQSQKLAGTRILYWYREPLRDDTENVLEWLTEPPETTAGAALGRARALLTAIRDGERPDLEDNRYYALTLSANSGRVVLRDWMEGSFEHLVHNVARWFDDLQVVSRDGLGLTAPPKLWAVLGALVRELDELPDPLVAKMWRVAVRNEPIPQQTAARALARVRIAKVTDQPVRTAGVGLLKAFLRRLPDGGHSMEPKLNESHPHPAYQCGRLMAVLDYLQYRALGEVGAGVVQRYYAAASSTPGLVLGRLLRMAQFHLGKLEPHERRSFEYRIGQVMGQLEDGFPSPLSLQEQSLFALGYYHQKSYRPPKDETADADAETETSEETA
jgi:CRISPR-associated protein Csd1